MKKRDKILQAAKSRLVDAFGEQIRDVILFGSRAWGRPKPWSDYDFVVVVRGRDTSSALQDAINRVMYTLESDYDILTQTLVIAQEELENSLRGAQPIFQTALSKGLYA